MVKHLQPPGWNKCTSPCATKRVKRKLAYKFCRKCFFYINKKRRDSGKHFHVTSSMFNVVKCSKSENYKSQQVAKCLTLKGASITTFVKTFEETLSFTLCLKELLAFSSTRGFEGEEETSAMEPASIKPERGDLHKGII